MSALRSLIPIGAGEADRRLSRAAASVAKREAHVRDLCARLASLEAAGEHGATDEDEGAVHRLIVLRREIAQTEEELAAYREAQSRAQQLRDVVTKEAEARQKAARAAAHRATLKTLRSEIEKQLEKLVELAGKNESVRSRLSELENSGAYEYSLETYVESVNSGTVGRYPDKRAVVGLSTFGNRSVERDYCERKTISVQVLLLVPLVESE